MRYYAKYDELNTLLAIGTGTDGEEITKEEYDNLLIMIRDKADLVNKLYNNEITANDVPQDWQEEIQRRVNERLEWDKEELELGGE